MPSASPPPNFDPAAAYPAVNDIRRALAARDWPAVRAVVTGQDPTMQTLLLEFAGEDPIAGAFLQSIVDRGPADSLAATVLARHLIWAGWEIRTGNPARYVSTEKFAAFHDHLRRAEQILIDVTARDPAATAAWVFRLLTARGLRLGQAEARRRYDHAVRHATHHLPAQTQYLQQVCPKWSGTLDKMHAFARECMIAAPPGSLNAVIVVRAHLEHWLDLDDADGRRYLTDPRVQAEIRDAAARSIFHPIVQRTAGWVEVLNTFAMAFGLIGDHASAARCFDATGNLATELPWAYLGDATKAFVKHRRRATAKGKR